MNIKIKDILLILIKSIFFTIVVSVFMQIIILNYQMFLELFGNSSINLYLIPMSFGLVADATICATFIYLFVFIYALQWIRDGIICVN